MTDPPVEKSISERIETAIKRGDALLTRGSVRRVEVQVWVSLARTILKKIFGSEANTLSLWKSLATDNNAVTPDQIIQAGIAALKALREDLLRTTSVRSGPTLGRRIFIGHGRSPAWRELKDFLADRLHLEWDEFNRDSVAGLTIAQRLAALLSDAKFAFLIMTAEDEHADATKHARENVIHEIGLFQGRLGQTHAIVLLEEGCQIFSNIHGLTYISFPPGRISATFEEIRMVLEREGIIET